MTDKQLAARQALSAKLMGEFTNPHQAPSYLKEVFYFVPLIFGCTYSDRPVPRGPGLVPDRVRLPFPAGQVDGRQAAPGTLPADKPLPDRRQIYYGLTLEELIPTEFQRPVNWPRKGSTRTTSSVPRDFADPLHRDIAGALLRGFRGCGIHPGDRRVNGPRP